MRKLTLIFFILFISILKGNKITHTENILPIIECDINTQNPLIWVSDWLLSDDMGSGYGKGHFYYRFARTSYPDNSGNYRYEIYFLSDSYYDAYMYNGDAYRCATKIDEVKLFVGGQPYVNNVTNSHSFWLIFQGDYTLGNGDLRISFYHPQPNANVYITWTQPKPF